MIELQFLFTPRAQIKDFNWAPCPSRFLSRKPLMSDGLNAASVGPVASILSPRASMTHVGVFFLSFKSDLLVVSAWMCVCVRVCVYGIRKRVRYVAGNQVVCNGPADAGRDTVSAAEGSDLSAATTTMLLAFVFFSCQSKGLITRGLIAENSSFY